MISKRRTQLVPLLATLALMLVPAVAHAAPEWEKNNVLLGATHVAVSTKGVLAVSIQSVGVVKCKVTDTEEIWNPGSGKPGEDSFTAFGPAPCKGTTALCTSHTYTLVPEGLPWASVLVAGTPVRDEFSPKFGLECNSVVVDKLHGTLTPEVALNLLNFSLTSGTLTDSGGNSVDVIGKDKITGSGKVKAS